MVDRLVPMLDPMLDHTLEPPRPVRRMEVMTGPGQRRRWSSDQKARILEEATAAGAIVSEVARRHGIAPQHLFTWRRQGQQRAVESHPALAPVVVAPDLLPTRMSDPAGVIGIAVAGAVIRVPPGVDGPTLVTILQALKIRP